jgi:excinuclease UvrABC helicase subunit UvrB
MKFQVVSDYVPTGDQPQAIEKLAKGIINGEKYQTLLGVTGSGKTFTVANVVQEVQKPTLVLAHNKTLAAQLYSEFKQFFPNNSVQYFVSYYDYYQPEAFIPVTGTYIEKDLSINEELEKLRLSTTSALLSGRRDIIVISSVSCLYGIGNPVEFQKNVISLKSGQAISRTKLLHQLVQSLYARTEMEFTPGTFRIKGDTVEVFPSYADDPFRIHFFGDDSSVYPFGFYNRKQGTVTATTSNNGMFLMDECLNGNISDIDNVSFIIGKTSDSMTQTVLSNTNENISNSGIRTYLKNRYNQDSFNHIEPLAIYNTTSTRVCPL